MKITKKIIREMVEECMSNMMHGEQPVSVKELPKNDVSHIDPDGYEGAMAKSNLFNMAKNATELHNLIGDQENLEPWVEEKIAVAAQMIDSVTDHITYQKTSGKR